MELGILEILLFIAVQLICFMFFIIIFTTYCIVIGARIRESFSILVFVLGVEASVMAAKFFLP